MWYRFFFLNIFLFFLKTDFTELFRAFELRASIRISQKEKNPETIRLSNRVSSSFSSFNAPVNLKQWGVQSHDTGVSRNSVIVPIWYVSSRSMLIRPGLSDELFSSVLSHRYPPSHNGCSIQAPRYSTAFVLEW